MRMKILNAVKNASGKFAIGAVASIASVPAFADNSEAITSAFTAAQGDVTTAATLLIATVAIVAGLGLVVSLLRR